MADEIVEPSEGGNSRRNLILLGVAAFLAVLLVVAIIFGILFFTGVLSTNEDLETRLASLEGGGQVQNNGDEESEDDGQPRLLELPDSNRLDTLYHQFGQVFTVNIMNSRKVMQLGLTLSTHYDQQVIDNVIKHELAVRSAILEHLSFITEEDTLADDFRQRVGEELVVVINAELEFVEGFGGIERALFTEFLVQ